MRAVVRHKCPDQHLQATIKVRRHWCCRRIAQSHLNGMQVGIQRTQGRRLGQGSCKHGSQFVTELAIQLRLHPFDIARHGHGETTPRTPSLVRNT